MCLLHIYTVKSRNRCYVINLYYRYSTVKANDKCAACNYPLMTRGFYLFPCQHKFHSDCLIEEVGYLFNLYI